MRSASRTRTRPTAAEPLGLFDPRYLTKKSGAAQTQIGHDPKRWLALVGGKLGPLTESGAEKWALEGFTSLRAESQTEVHAIANFRPSRAFADVLSEVEKLAPDP